MRAVFLDLNGTLVQPVRVLHPQEYTLIPGAIDAIRLLNQHGFICPVVTVQSRIAKGTYSTDDFLSWFHGFMNDLREQDAVVLGSYFCPHRGSDNCVFKKPRPDLYRQAASELDIDMRQSVIIGDTHPDILAAHELGCTSCLVRTGWGERELVERHAGNLATFVATDALDAAHWIAQQAALQSDRIPSNQ